MDRPVGERPRAALTGRRRIAILRRKVASTLLCTGAAVTEPRGPEAA